MTKAKAKTKRHNTVLIRYNVSVKIHCFEFVWMCVVSFQVNKVASKVDITWKLILIPSFPFLVVTRFIHLPYKQKSIAVPFFFSLSMLIPSFITTVTVLTVLTVLVITLVSVSLVSFHVFWTVLVARHNKAVRTRAKVAKAASSLSFLPGHATPWRKRKWWRREIPTWGILR